MDPLMKTEYTDTALRLSLPSIFIPFFSYVGGVLLGNHTSKVFLFSYADDLRSQILSSKKRLPVENDRIGLRNNVLRAQVVYGWSASDMANGNVMNKTTTKLSGMLCINQDSNMTLFFSPIKSTDTNCALFPDKS